MEYNTKYTFDKNTQFSFSLHDSHTNTYDR